MDLTRFQKTMLAVTAGMFVFFGLLMIVFRMHPGVLFEESLLKTTEYENQTVYSGKAHGTPVAITVTRDPGNAALTTVDFTIGTEFHDVCQVAYPLEQIQTEFGYPVSGIRVTKNGGVLFEGGYDPENELGRFDTNGRWTPFLSVSIRGQIPGDPWYGYETTAAKAVRFAFGPGTAAHGQPEVFGFAVFLSVLLVVDIFFYKEFFRWRHWAARDPEPTEEYLSLARAGWVLLAAIVAIAYIISLAEIS